MKRLEYKRGLVTLVFIASLAVASWLWCGDDFSVGRYALKSVDGLTFRGWFSFLASLMMVFLAAPHVLNIVLGRPLLEIRESELLVWALPYERIPLDDIEKVLVGDQITEIYRQDGALRKVLVSPSEQPRVFFFETMLEALEDRLILKEK